jgi:decaprenylphospho-beta-D-ribofuranose 2-oxidase
MNHKTTLSGWGNYPVQQAFVDRPERINQLNLEAESIIARGLGRSYGDAALNCDQRVILMERLNRFLSFDDKKGLLRAEAGTSLEEILQTFIPRGWFIPVTPGTKYVTLGGCLAADIHGKNHHIDGTFGSHVVEIELLLANGSRKRCSPKQESELFWATVGGMGLTGIITEVTLKLIPIESAFICLQNYCARNLDETLDILENEKMDDRYSVAWIDCLATGPDLGRSVIMNGHHAAKNELGSRVSDPYKIKPPKKMSIPFFLPSLTLNSWNIRMFNSCYYRSKKNKNGPLIIDYDRYFYPLDAINHWNRLYGKRGFLQYQFVVPFKNARESLHAILRQFAEHKRSPFLAVLKRFGKEGEGFLSFPKEGFTMALDLPLSDPELFPFLDQLDTLVVNSEGRGYLAKDARMKPDIFRSMYPRFNAWQKIKADIDPTNKFSSDLSRRLHMEGKR